MASQTGDGSAQLCARAILITVQTPDPSAHKVRHEFRIVFVGVYQREPLLRYIRKVDLPGNVTIGTPDTAIDWIDQWRAPIRIRIPVSRNTVKSFDPRVHEKRLDKRRGIGLFAVFNTGGKLGHDERTGQPCFPLGSIFQTRTITDTLNVLVTGCGKQNQNNRKNSQFHNYGILPEARFFSLQAGVSQGLRGPFDATVFSTKRLRSDRTS